MHGCFHPRRNVNLSHGQMIILSDSLTISIQSYDGGGGDARPTYALNGGRRRSPPSKPSFEASKPKLQLKMLPDNICTKNSCTFQPTSLSSRRAYRERQLVCAPENQKTSFICCLCAGGVIICYQNDERAPSNECKAMVVMVVVCLSQRERDVVVIMTV